MAAVMKFNFRIFGWIVLTLALFLFLLALGLPSILSSGWGRTFLLSQVNHQIPGEIAIEQMELSWFGQQQVRGITLKDPEGQVVLTAANLTADSSLFHLAWDGFVGTNTQLSGLQATLIQDASGNSNLQKALGLTAEKKTPSSFPYKIELTDVEMDIQMASLQEPISIHLKGKTKEENQEGHFVLEALLTGFEPDQIEQIKGNIHQFPVDLLDQFLALKNPEYAGLLRNILGKTLDISIDHKKLQNEVALQLNIQSSQFKADCYGTLDSEGVRLSQPCVLNLSLKPETIKGFSGDQPIKMRLQLDQAVLPLNERAIDLADLLLKGNMEIDQGAFNGFSLNQFHMAFEKPQGTKQLSLTTTGPLQWKSLALKDTKLQINEHDAVLTTQITSTEPNTWIHPTPLRLSVESIEDLASLQFSGKLSIDQLVVGDRQKAPVATLKNLVIPWQVDASNDSIHLTISGHTNIAPKQTEGTLAGSLEVNQWMVNGKPDFRGAVVNSNITLQAIPIPLWEALTGQMGYADLMGQTIDFDLTANWSADHREDGVLDVRWGGERIEGAVSLKKKGDYIVLNDANAPGQFKLKLTPAGFAAFHKFFRKEAVEHLALQEPAKVKGRILNLRFPWKEAKNWEKSALNAELTIDKLLINDTRTGQFIGLESLTGHLKSEQLERSIDFDLRGQQRNHKGNDSPVFLNGSIQEAFNKNNLSMNLQGEAKRLPAGLLCEVVCLESVTRLKLEAIFGPLVDFGVSVQMQRMNGPVHLQIQGENGKVSLDGRLNQGVFTLTKPFQAELTATPQLSEHVFADTLPILSGLVGADDRLRISVDPTGFSIPVHSPEIENLQMNSMTIELGKAYFVKEGTIGKIMHVLKARSGDKISVWFTPIYLSFRGGILNVERFDMLAMDRYPIATWGQVDVSADKVDMKIGLTGRSLQQALGLPIPFRNYMMQFPLRGTMGNATLDKSKLTAQIAALTAAIAGGPQGALIGTVLGVASGAFTGESTPPPTTNPLPWSTESEVQEESKQEEEEEGKTKKNPLKAVERGVNSLLKNIIR